LKVLQNMVVVDNIDFDMALVVADIVDKED
jgi:hypothetical protein